ncbi:MAG TPA: M20/M25/M40 family metallo-hydrolase [Solirubrobacteraceae bacterium]|nr:M20/M25/M40 family metallo-hydrolase [Solirubrobacteraceae bacterium]
MTAASEVERRRLGECFAALCRVYSPSRAERACAELVRGELAGLGVEVSEDKAARAIGGDCGNLLARLPGSGPGSLLFCAHMDTVPAAAPIQPVLRDGGWENENDAILGADNKTAVAVLLALARRLVAEPAESTVELLFTVGEEVGLLGAKEFETGVLRSHIGYTLDASMPIGAIVIASPTYYRVGAELRGVASHAGVSPELGRSAILAAARGIARMQLGRIDRETTANIGTIEGGSAANVVPDRCRILGEARSVDGDRAQEVASAMVACLADAANDPECECDLDVTVERECDGYRIRSTAPELVLVSNALRDLGYTPELAASGGASDANALRSKGCAVLNLGNGTEHPHEPDERVSVEALEGTLDLALALVDRAGAAG